MFDITRQKAKKYLNDVDTFISISDVDRIQSVIAIMPDDSIEVMPHAYIEFIRKDDNRWFHGNLVDIVKQHFNNEVTR